MYPLWNIYGAADQLTSSLGQPECNTNPGGIPASPCASFVRQSQWLPYLRMATSSRAWQGSLLEEKKDASGLMYRRNRYYDPKTGRFTQEDPLGLGGGMNLYGFAGGDPVNFSDPFGLCPVTATDPVPCSVTYGAALGAIGGWLGIMAAGGCTVGSGGICLAGAPAIIGGGAALGTLAGVALGNALDGKAPDQVTPGIRDIRGVYYPPDRTKPEPYDAHYDQFGRQVGRTDWTGQPDPETHTDPHHHTREYGPQYGPKGKESKHDGPHPDDANKPRPEP
jgi:RHS repeat-associated protein